MLLGRWEIQQNPEQKRNPKKALGKPLTRQYDERSIMKRGWYSLAEKGEA
jgi:hypothetical protein